MYCRASPALIKRLAFWLHSAPLVLFVEGLALAAGERCADLLLVLVRERLAPGAVAAPDLALRGLQRCRAAPVPLLAHWAGLERPSLHRHGPG